MTYPLTVAEIRARRLTRDKQRILSDADRLAYQRREIREEYQRVSRIYAAHLERLNKKMASNVSEYAKLAERTTELAESHRPQDDHTGSN